MPVKLYTAMVNSAVRHFFLFSEGIYSVVMEY
jgi:hypothetical protein